MSAFGPKDDVPDVDAIVSKVLDFNTLGSTVAEIQKTKADMAALPATCHPERGTSGFRRNGEEISRLCSDCLVTHIKSQRSGGTGESE